MHGTKKIDRKEEERMQRNETKRNEKWIGRGWIKNRYRFFCKVKNNTTRFFLIVVLYGNVKGTWNIKSQFFGMRDDDRLYVSSVYAFEIRLFQKEYKKEKSFCCLLSSIFISLVCCYIRRRWRNVNVKSYSLWLFYCLAYISICFFYFSRHAA